MGPAQNTRTRWHERNCHFLKIPAELRNMYVCKA
jgi:hypothetical protein